MFTLLGARAVKRLQRASAGTGGIPHVYLDVYSLAFFRRWKFLVVYYLVSYLLELKHTIAMFGKFRFCLPPVMQPAAYAETNGHEREKYKKYLEYYQNDE
jgi:hypothetical protein